MKRLELLSKIREVGGFKTPSLCETLLECVVQSEGKTLAELEDVQVMELKNTLKVFISKSKMKLNKHNRKYEVMFER